LLGPTITFTWAAGSSSTAYWLDVGTTPGGTNLYSALQGSGLSQTVTGLPTAGGTVYVRLWSTVGGVWIYTDYVFETLNGAGAALLTAPQGPGLTSSTVTFTWAVGSNATRSEEHTSEL